MRTFASSHFHPRQKREQQYDSIAAGVFWKQMAHLYPNRVYTWYEEWHQGVYLWCYTMTCKYSPSHPVLDTYTAAESHSFSVHSGQFNRLTWDEVGSCLNGQNSRLVSFVFSPVQRHAIECVCRACRTQYDEQAWLFWSLRNNVLRGSIVNRTKYC